MTTFRHPTPTCIPVPHSRLYHIYLSPCLNIGRSSREEGCAPPQNGPWCLDIFIIFMAWIRYCPKANTSYHVDHESYSFLFCCQYTAPPRSDPGLQDCDEWNSDWASCLNTGWNRLLPPLAAYCKIGWALIHLIEAPLMLPKSCCWWTFLM